MSIFKKCFALFGVAVVFVCSLCIPAFASTDTTYSNPDNGGYAVCPDLEYFDEGGWYWLSDVHREGFEYARVKVHKEVNEEGFEIDDRLGCPERIVKNSSFYFVQTYPQDNVYELYSNGIATGMYYSLIDFDGTGYYTILMGSPCEYAYLKVEFVANVAGSKKTITAFLKAKQQEFDPGTGKTMWALTSGDTSVQVLATDISVKWDNDAKKLTAYYTDPSGKSNAVECSRGIAGSSNIFQAVTTFAPVEADFKWEDIDNPNTVFLYGGGLWDGGKEVVKAGDFTNTQSSTGSVTFRNYTVTPDYNILSACRNALDSVIDWIGSVATMVTSSTVFPILCIGIGVSVFGIVFMYIRKMTFGA